MATAIGVHGNMSEFAVRTATLETMQCLIGGYIEVVNIGHGVLIVDEEGLVKGLPMNMEASLQAGMPIVGKAVYMDNAEWQEFNK